MRWDGRLLDTDWVVVGAAGAPAFQNGWANYGGTYVPTRFRRKNGIVTVQLMAKSGTLNTTVFTLPVGYRASADLPPFAGVDGGGVARSLSITAVGAIASSGATSNASLSCIVSFPAEA